MIFLDRQDELARLTALVGRRGHALAVLVGRRRIGKTRILVEWARRCDGLYVVADESAAHVQRRFVAEAVSERFPGFAEVEYPEWAALLTRLAAEAKAIGWRGPVILDELPYLVTASPELPSVLQRWIDHEARDARLVVAVAGSSQRMMQGLVLDANAPLFGRADEILDVGPMAPVHLTKALDLEIGPALVEAYAAWGGVPRYWELARETRGDTLARLERLALDPLGPLHREPERLLQEDLPSAQEVRPVLDAIGAGAHRLSEIAGRLGRPATSMARPLARLLGLGLLRRDVPFGESERQSRRALYRIADSFVRLWFRVVAPHRAALTTGTAASRRALLERFWPGLASEAWEEICRLGVPKARPRSRLAALGPWGPCSRWWRGEAPEWDLVSLSEGGRRLLLGEVKWRDRPFDRPSLARALDGVRSRPAPPLREADEGSAIHRALFVPVLSRGCTLPKDVLVVTAADVVG